MRLYNLSDNGVLTLPLLNQLPDGYSICRGYGCNVFESKDFIYIDKKVNDQITMRVQRFDPKNYKEIIVDYDLSQFGFRRVGISRWKNINKEEL